MLKRTWMTRWLMVALVLLFTTVVAAGCTQPAEQDGGNAEEVENGHEVEDDHGMEEGVRVPNNGAAIRIVSPADGSTFASGEDIVVEVEIENFELNVDGSHWHVYVDGTSYGMVVGETTSQVLRNLEPGEHVVTAYLATGDHIELEDPGQVTITVTE